MTTDNTNKTYFFNSKEEYLAFKAQWAAAVNSSKAKPSLEQGYSGGTYIKPGWITSVHHMIYNIVRDKPADFGFTKITNKNKLEKSKMKPDHGFLVAEASFERLQRTAKKLLTDDRMSSWDKERLQDVMKPFGGLLSLEKFANYTPKREHR